MKTKELIRQVAFAQPEHICQWHIDPPCGKPGRTRVNFEDGPIDVCDMAVEELREMDPNLLTDEKELRW